MADSKMYTKEGLLGLIDGLPLAIAVVDKARKVVLANKAAQAFTNKDKARLIGRVGGDALGCQFSDDVPEGCGFGDECLKCRLRDILDQTMRDGRSHFMETISMGFKLHGKRYLRITTQPLRVDKDTVVLLAMEDVTEAKKHQKLELEKEKLSAVVQTTGAVCHEMNQPLMAILGFSELLLGELNKGRVKAETVMEIRQGAEKLGEITHKLMSVTSYQTKKYLSGEILDLEKASQPETNDK